MNKPRGRPFQPGNTLGRGRPKGSHNRAKSPEQNLFDEYALPLARKCLSSAPQGDRSLLRMFLGLMAPASRDASIRMSLPSTRTAQDVDQAAEKVTQDVGRGKITPIEGERMMHILESRSRIIDSVQTAGRVDKLEEQMAARDLPRAA